ncbi:MAG: hypothetical protein FJ008_04315 [Chloroflexi bacterium]|nr:hypothetical protein [Chloroflexota bacterium]MBM3154539.1 hypothetical protein [Chloroflexota bacterium]
MRVVMVDKISVFADDRFVVTKTAKGGLSTMTEQSVALPLEIVKKFTLDTVRVQFVQINQEVNHTYQMPFPKQRSRLISWYEYGHLEIELDENGQVKGGIVWLVAALFDFTLRQAQGRLLYAR